MTVGNQSLTCDTKCANVKVVRKGKCQMSPGYTGSLPELTVFRATEVIPKQSPIYKQKFPKGYPTLSS